MVKTNNKEKILIGVREIPREITRMIADFSLVIMLARKQHSKIFKILTFEKSQPRILYLAEIFFKN